MRSRASRPSSTAGSSIRTTRVLPSSAAGACRRYSCQATTERSRNGDANRAAGGRSRERSLRDARRAARRVAAGDRVCVPAHCARGRLPGRRAGVELRDAYDALRDPERARAVRRRAGRLRRTRRRRRRSRTIRSTACSRICRTAGASRIDWVVTIAGAIAIVLAIKAWVVNPYRIPSSSMEPTLHCAQPAAGLRGAHLRPRAREPLHLPLPRSRSGARSSSFKTPKLALRGVRFPGTFVKRLIGLPGEVWEERTGFVYINGKKLNEPYVKADPARPRRSACWTSRPEHLHPDPEGLLPDDGRQPQLVLRLPPLGPRSRGRT